MGFDTVTVSKYSDFSRVRPGSASGVKVSVTLIHAGEKETYLEQIDKLVKSHVLHGSESLCKMLQYLAHHALNHPGVSVKEYQIATEVFGRPTDFDPHLDATVRVQAGRLRAKLAEYYGGVGHDDPVVVELPKGSYAVSFHPRSLESVARATPGSYAALDELAKQPSARNLIFVIIVLGVLLAGSIAVNVGLAWARRSRQAVASLPADAAPPVFHLFWQPFLNGPEEPWVVFSNAGFIGRPETGMRYFNPAKDSPDHILDHYTGVGEVLAVSDLDHLFGQMRHRIRIKRGSLFTLDDAKNNDLIFVGSPAENLALTEIPNTQEFVFQRVPSGPRKGDLAIFNMHPKAGERSAFLPSPPTPPLAEDYSIIALIHGLNPARSTLILAGTSTIGTQAAVEYVCQPNSLQELLRQLDVSNSSELKPFEAVLRVQVRHDVPVESKLVAVRKDLP